MKKRNTPKPKILSLGLGMCIGLKLIVSAYFLIIKTVSMVVCLEKKERELHIEEELRCFCNIVIFINHIQILCEAK